DGLGARRAGAAETSAGAGSAFHRRGWFLGQRVGPEAIPRAPYGLDRRAPERPVDSLPQGADVNLDQVRGALVGEVPDVFEDALPGQHLPGVAHEVLEQGELLGG